MKFSITREGIYYLFVVLVILVGSIVREVNPMLLFSAFLCAPLIIAWRLGRRSIRGIQVVHRLPTQVFAGEPFIVHLEATNTKTKSRRALSAWGVIVIDRIRPVYVESRDRKSVEEKPFEPAVYFEFLPGNKTVRKTYAGRLPQRGRYRVGPAVVSTRFPFGFFLHSVEQAAQDDEKTEFCVFPKLGRLSTTWRTRSHEAVESTRRLRFRPSRVSGEFLGVRRWQRGDAKKWIHWRAWAKHNQPFVRQFEKNQNRDCTVLLDLFPEAEGVGEDEQRENFELAVSFTATLVSEMTRLGGCNMFFATGRTGDAFLGGPVCLPLAENIFQALALAEPSRDDALAPKLLKMLSMVDPHAELILVSPCPIDLAASPRFQEIRNDPRFRVLLQRLRIVDTSNPSLEDFFLLDEPAKISS